MVHVRNICQANYQHENCMPFVWVIAILYDVYCSKEHTLNTSVYCFSRNPGVIKKYNLHFRIE